MTPCPSWASLAQEPSWARGWEALPKLGKGLGGLAQVGQGWGNCITHTHGVGGAGSTASTPRTRRDLTGGARRPTGGERGEATPRRRHRET